MGHSANSCSSCNYQNKSLVTRMRKFDVNSVAYALVIFNCVYFTTSNAYMVGHNPHHRSETLDKLGRYQLEYFVDFDAKQVTFNVTVQTKGYVGFGLSSKGTMSGADIVIGGVTSNGKSYFSDRHSVGNHLPNIDSRQDWKLNEAWESASHTFLSFSRAFDTCDPEDYPISADKVSLIWAFGETDTEIGYHHQHRGSHDLYLLDPDYAPQIIRDVQDMPKVIGRESAELKIWSISKHTDIPSNETAYLCSMYRGPRLHEKHHIVGFDLHFNSEESKQYIHNLLIYKCNAPPGKDARSMFEPFLKEHAQSCLVPHRPEGSMPTDYCTELLHEWAMGGKSYFVPNELGYPLGAAQDEYYMVQIHFDNPERNAATVDFDLELYYTSKLRSNDAGIMVIGHETPGLTPSLLIPANSPSHMIFGHCGSECTKLMLPSSGIKVFAVALYSHGSGKQLRLQHFRNNRELHFISSDENYGFSYKQVRNLQDHVKVLPGDHLIMRCVYDNTKRNGTVVGGFSSSQEMCLAYIHYYNKIGDFGSCKSEIISEDYRRRFLGVTNATWDESRQQFVVDMTEPHAGLTVSEVADNHVLWEPETRAEFERFHKYHPQINRCSRELYAREEHGGDTNETTKTSRNGSKDEYTGSTSYPFSAKEHLPEQSCSLNISY